MAGGARRTLGSDGSAVVPSSFAELLGEFGGCFSAWTFPVFSALACGLVAGRAQRTVCAMLVGAQRSRTWSHHRAHRFFSHARWSVDQLSAVLVRLVVRALVPEGEVVLVAIDDTLFQRRGPKVFAASWFHDGSAAGAKKVGYGNNWVIAAIVVKLPMLDRSVALPVAFWLVEKGKGQPSRLDAALRLVTMLSQALEGRRIDVVADAAYAGKVLGGLPNGITWTTRLRSNAALYELAPPPTGRRGRPRVRGDRLASLSVLAQRATFSPVNVSRYQKTTTVEVAVIRCLWYRVFGRQEVQVVLVRDKTKSGYDIALVTTDLAISGGLVIERYAARWSIEVSIEDAKQTGGVGQARNRVQLAVERTVPFALMVNTLTIVWYATVGYHPDDVDERRALAPWYRDKAQPSVLDMFTKLRRVIVANYLRSVDPEPPTAQEITLLRLAWEDVAA
jgi:DDE superfamily endonuclease